MLFDIKSDDMPLKQKQQRQVGLPAEKLATRENMLKGMGEAGILRDSRLSWFYIEYTHMVGGKQATREQLVLLLSNEWETTQCTCFETNTKLFKEVDLRFADVMRIIAPELLDDVIAYREKKGLTNERNGSALDDASALQQSVL